jgi:hypothetical protein
MLLLIVSATSAAELRIQVRDQASRPIWARLEVRGVDGKMYQPPSALRDRTAGSRPGGEPWYLGSFVVEGQASLQVPPGRYTVVAEHGLEFERVERSVEVSEQQPALAQVRLRPWIRMHERGWYSGDLHLHRPPEDSSSLALAEDLNVSVVFTMWNKRNLWAGKALPADPVMRASPNHLVMLMNAEDERGGGAWLLDGIPKPLPLGVDGRWFPPGITFVRQARALRPSGAVFPWFDCEKPFWWEVPVMMALAAPDSLGVVHNHFNQYGMNNAEAWGRPRDAGQFPPSHEGFVNYTLSLYYRYLNLGFRLPPSAGSASGVLPNPPGYNRVYVQVSGPLSVEKWFAALREGPSFVTNGPILFFKTKRAGSRLTASLEARAREAIERVEIVANGEVLKQFSPKADSRSFKAAYSFDPKNHSWVAARCFLKPGATIRLAHSSPVYLDGRWDARADARYFFGWIDELIAQTTADAKRFANPAERDQMLALYREARAFYEARAR